MHGKIQSPLSVIATELCTDIVVNGEYVNTTVFINWHFIHTLRLSSLCAAFDFNACCSFVQASRIELEPSRGFVLRTLKHIKTDCVYNTQFYVNEQEIMKRTRTAFTPSNHVYELRFKPINVEHLVCVECKKSGFSVHL